MTGGWGAATAPAPKASPRPLIPMWREAVVTHISRTRRTRFRTGMAPKRVGFAQHELWFDRVWNCCGQVADLFIMQDI